MLGVTVVAAGLSWRSGVIPLPQWLSNHGGDALNSLTKFCPTCCQKRQIGGNKTRTAECKHCQQLFSSSGRGRALYCGPCREKYPNTLPRHSEKPCENCGKHFTHMRQEARFCSFKCSSTWVNATGQGPRHNDDELLARIVGVINKHERCLSQEELIAEVGTSHKVLAAREWSMAFLYTSAGRSYEAPVLNSRFEDRVYSVLSEIVPGMVIEHDKTLRANCWDRSNKLWLTSRALQEDDIPTLKDELVAFIQSRGRYVWHPEVYMYFRSVSIDDLKKHGIKVATICRELGLFAPEDDRLGRETVQRVKDFVLNHLNVHGKLPGLRLVLKEVGIDHTTLWTYMDYDQFVAGLGGKDRAIVRYRFRDAEDFLNAAADVVKMAGRSMRMTEIVKAVGISYPSYLSNFKSVRSEDIHDRAGVARFSRENTKA
jgi:hypothetical protein